MTYRQRSRRKARARMQALRADRRRLHLCRDCGQPVTKQGARWAVRCERCQATAAARKRRRRALIAVLSGRPVPATLTLSTLAPAPAPTVAGVQGANSTLKRPERPTRPTRPTRPERASRVSLDELEARHGKDTIQAAWKAMRAAMQQRAPRED